MASGQEDEQLGDLPFDDETFGVSEAEAVEAYSYSGDVFDQLDTLGLGNCGERPVLEEDHVGLFRGLEVGSYFDGRLPTTLRAFSLDQVSVLYSLLTAWHGYIIMVLNEIKTKRSEALQQKELMWSMIRMKHLKFAKKLGLNLTDQRLSDLARYDERFVEANKRYLELNALYDCVESLRKIAEKNMEVVSREITVRDVQLNSEARGRGIGGPSRFATDRYTGSVASMPESNKKKGTPPRVEDREETDRNSKSKKRQITRAKPGVEDRKEAHSNSKPKKRKIKINRAKPGGGSRSGPRKAKRD